MMDRRVFNIQFAALIKAFLYSEKKIDPETQDVYWEMLKEIPEDKFKTGVRHCLATCKFFPTIAELGEASMPAIEKQISRTRVSGNYAQDAWTRDHYLEVQEQRHPEFKKIDWQEQLNAVEEKETHRLPSEVGEITDSLAKKLTDWKTEK